MAYSDFTLPQIIKAFDLTVSLTSLWADLTPSPPTPWLVESLDKAKSLAFNSEKARSELLVMPILLTSRDAYREQMTIYSGERLDVAQEKGLVGECDFIITASQPYPIVQAPILTVVEAKRNDIDNTLGQCVAQMLGASYFNEQENRPRPVVYGCVTTGEIWRFMKLIDRQQLILDRDRYYLDRVELILGALNQILHEQLA